jgi:hypothetical protein
MALIRLPKRTMNLVDRSFAVKLQAKLFPFATCITTEVRVRRMSFDEDRNASAQNFLAASRYPCYTVFAPLADDLHISAFAPHRNGHYSI